MTLETAERELAALQTDHQAKLQAIMRRNGSTQDLIDQLIRNAEESILLEYKLRNEWVSDSESTRRWENMTKRNFIALADTLRAFLETNAGVEMDSISRGILIQHLANFCQSQNPNFKRERWLSCIAGECGPNGGTR